MGMASEGDFDRSAFANRWSLRGREKYEEEANDLSASLGPYVASCGARFHVYDKGVNQDFGLEILIVLEPSTDQVSSKSQVHSAPCRAFST
jgi:hypothetical protein